MAPPAEKRSNQTPARVRVGIVDDHPLFRLGLRQALMQDAAIDVAWDVGSAADALRLLATDAVDVVLMDVHLGAPPDGVTAAAMITGKSSRTKVIMMSAFVDEDVLRAALQARAVGYLAKDLPPEEVRAAVKALANPAPAPPLTVVTNLLDRYQGRREPSPPRQSLLTAREVEVLAQIRQGRSNKEIARHLGITYPTVAKHVRHVLQKLQAKNRAHAASLGSRMVKSDH